jgi:hypothetical protein
LKHPDAQDLKRDLFKVLLYIFIIERDMCCQNS